MENPPLNKAPHFPRRKSRAGGRVSCTGSVPEGCRKDGREPWNPEKNHGRSGTGGGHKRVEEHRSGVDPLGSGRSGPAGGMCSWWRNLGVSSRLCPDFPSCHPCLQSLDSGVRRCPAASGYFPDYSRRT